MALLTLICDGYIQWAQSAEAGEFFEQEFEFYLMCLKTFIAIMAFLGLVLIPSLLHQSKSSLSKLMLGLLLSYCSRFCNLIALLWAPSQKSLSLSTWDKLLSPDFGMWGFIIALFFISSVRVYQGILFLTS